MNKVYDRVEWSFLEKVLLRFSFSSSWVKLIMVCISSVTYRIKINGDLSSPIFSSETT